MASNEILTFAGTDTGTNLLTQAEYTSDSQRAIGNQPGIARSKLVNKAMRQTTLVAASLAQYIANRQGSNVVDTKTVSELEAMLVAAISAQINAALPEGLPASTVIWTPRSTAPTGYLKANGATVSRTTYAALFAQIGTMFGAGDGSTTFNLPDMRGVFPRGWDDGRGVDTGRALGSLQADALQNITGYAGVNLPYYGQLHVTGGAMIYTDNIGGGTSGGGGSNGSAIINFDASRVARTAAETRPTNVALLACIKY